MFCLNQFDEPGRDSEWVPDIVGQQLPEVLQFLRSFAELFLSLDSLRDIGEDSRKQAFSVVFELLKADRHLHLVAIFV